MGWAIAFLLIAFIIILAQAVDYDRPQHQREKLYPLAALIGLMAIVLVAIRSCAAL